MKRVFLSSFLLLAAGQAPAAESGHWTFEKISKYDRSLEPVALGMPFPRGALRHAGRFVLSDDGERVPLQATVTSSWPDGSVRWLFVRALVNLPGNRSKRIEWTIEDNPAPPKPGLRLSQAAGGAVEVDTGPLQAKIPAEGFHPLTDVRLNGRPVGAGAWMRGFTIASGGAAWSTAQAGPVKIEILEQGPVAAVVRVSGRHGGNGSAFDFSAILTFWSGKPYVSLEYTVLAARAAGDTPVKLWEWRGAPGEGGRARLSHGSSAGQVSESTEKLSYSFGARQFRFDSVEHAFQSYWGDFWCDWTGGENGVAVTLRHAQQNFPKAMEAGPEGLVLSLYPAQEEALAFPLGAAKTHTLLFHFHAADETRERISARSLQFQVPDLPKLDPAWFARARVWEDRVFEGPRSRRVDAALSDILDNRPVGMGILNFGDEIEWGYTAQGRGQDDVVWLNNEYDFTHQCFLAWARSGERRFLDYARVNALHWRDVDIAHVSTRPERRQGHIAHSARHVTGGVTPSHQWVQGLLDAWHVFGDTAARDAAIGVGENILRVLPKHLGAGGSTRDAGWALRALLALYNETGDAKYLEPCRQIAELFKTWHREYPGLLSRYTDHSMVRVIFMNSLTLVSLARYYLQFPDEELKRVLLEETDDMIRHGRNANGLFIYKELPSLKHQGSTAMMLQALAYAYLISGDRRYLEAGLPELEYQILNGNLRFMVHTGAAEKFATPVGGYSRPLLYVQGGKFVGVSLMPMIEFLHIAGSPELARQLDFQLRLP
ncbi:MAG: hypothetical protein AAB225_16915 [Acidobacteriota bacterium]